MLFKRELKREHVGLLELPFFHLVWVPFYPCTVVMQPHIIISVILQAQPRAVIEGKGYLETSNKGRCVYRMVKLLYKASPTGCMDITDIARPLFP